MPFKLKLKKTRAYNVASKSLFVISVELLDGGIADCTLSVESTGQECLENVCQRQAINQPEFFGLRYFNNNQQYKWIELERPLKRQLDKYASSHQLHLRIMYYVRSGTGLITDEVTRNHYFLQCKNDLLEGRIACDFQQAVVLASYSRQAEYGNHDRERHTVEYLKNLLTFPKQIIDIDITEAGRLEWLTAAVIKHHTALHNMSQAQAENSFISVCQQLRFYGQELFAARDGSKPITIAVSLNGISLLAPDDEIKHVYKWEDITNVINHKRTFTIELTHSGQSTSLQLPTPEEGKYVWRMCIVQHTFHKILEKRTGQDNLHDKVQLTFQDHSLSESREELDRVDRSCSLEPSQRAYSTSCLELSVAGHSVRSLLPQYRPAPDYETAIQQKYQQQQTQTHTPKPIVYGSHPDIHRLYPDVTHVTPDYQLLSHNYTPFAVNPNVHARFTDMYKPPPPYPSGFASNSTPDLAVASQINYLRYISPHVSGSSPDLVSTRNALNRPYFGYINNNQHIVNYRPAYHASTHGTYHNLSSVHDIQSPYINDVLNRYRDLPNVPVKPTNTSEPIYENIPLPWDPTDYKGPMRDRAQSLSTTEEIARLNARNSSNPTISNYNMPENSSHYMNAQMIKDSNENTSGSLHNIINSIDKLSMSKCEDETPYQSLSMSRVNNNLENVTSINVPDIKVSNISIEHYSSGVDSGVVNSAYNTSLESESSVNTTKNTTTSSKEKKRRRWGMFMGRGDKGGEVKSATLGRDRSKNTTNTPANKHRWSTGLPKFQPLPPSITKETLCQLLERKMSDNQLSFAFEQIPKGRETGGELTTALLPENAAINGYNSEYLPYEDNRVRLHATSQNRCGYINASHITMTVGSTQRFYMVAKIPSSAGGTVPCRHSNSGPPGGLLLWDSAWCAGSRLIADIGEQTPTYLPALHTKHDYGKLSVWCESRCVSEWGVTSCLKVCGPHPPARTVYHVHFTKWPSTVTVPNIDLFLNFLSELSGLRLACASTESGSVHSKNAPLIVCCENGAGKSGVTLAADLLMFTLDHNQELDIPRTVTLLNQQRANLIQNVHQYKFLHQILLHYLKQSRLI